MFKGTVNKRIAAYMFSLSIVMHASSQHPVQNATPRGMASQHLWSFERSVKLSHGKSEPIIKIM